LLVRPSASTATVVTAPFGSVTDATVPVVGSYVDTVCHEKGAGLVAVALSSGNAAAGEYAVLFVRPMASVVVNGRPSESYVTDSVVDQCATLPSYRSAGECESSTHESRTHSRKIARRKLSRQGRHARETRMSQLRFSRHKGTSNPAPDRVLVPSA